MNPVSVILELVGASPFFMIFYTFVISYFSKMGRRKVSWIKFSSTQIIVIYFVISAYIYYRFSATEAISTPTMTPLPFFLLKEIVVASGFLGAVLGELFDIKIARAFLKRILK